MKLNLIAIQQYLDYSLNQDIGIMGDITSNALIKPEQMIDFKIIAKEEMIFCGSEIVEYYFSDKNIKYILNSQDAEHIAGGSVILEGNGNARKILLLERTILNFLQHLCGIATITNKYVQKTANTKAKILDTRKTIPGLRSLQKYAVRCGGGYNHRLGLDSSILIKDNHIVICGGVENALKLAKASAPFYTKIEIECDNIEQVKEALGFGIDIIMLDNMSIDEMTDAVKIIGNKALIDASGGVNLANVQKIAQLGVDYISIGALTHSARAIDIGLDILRSFL